jgi:alpha-L-rhamnosidase
VRLLLQDTFPSWLYQVRSGATTMWERWDTWTDAKGFSTSYTTEGRRTIE